jgi:tripartite ATP-independent transporter DctM subunit
MSLAFGICLATLFLLAAIGTPIAFSIISSAVVYLVLAGQDVGLAGEQIIYGLYDSFVLLAVPLFIVAANIMNAGSISERLLNFCVGVVGRFKGGLGHVNIVSSLIFSGMSGSAVADAAGIGKVIIQMMTRDGRYSPGYAAAITAASATIGPVIPPSIPMVIYALVSDTSIGFLFLGGILPGLLMGIMLMAMNVYLSHKRGFEPDAVVPIRELPALTIKAFPALLMPVILMWGIYGGVTTSTEAAAVAAAYAFILAAVFYRTLSFSGMRAIMLDSVKSSASVGLVIGGALILNYIVASENIPALLAETLQSLDVSPLTFLLGVNVLLLLLGCILDATTIILVIIPLFLQACRSMGIDLVHFGVVAVINCMIGLITPPYGILLFVINGTTGIKLADMIREIWPFLVALLLALLVLILVPEIVLWLPMQFGYVPAGL